MFGGVVVAALALGGLAAVAPPASAAGPGVGGGAYGVALTGAVPVGPTPSVTQPPGGSATGVPVVVPGVLSTGVLSVSSTSSNVGGPTASTTSTANVASLGVLSTALSAGAITTTCTSGAGGSVASTTVANLRIAGVAVTLPAVIPANYSITVPGVASVQLNHQVTADAPGSTRVTADGVYVQLVGGLSTITVAQAACSATGPDVHAPPAVTGISPTTGPNTGATTVTLTGTDLSGATSVDFGSTPATSVTVLSPTQLTAVAPAGTGAVDVTVGSAAGTSPVNPPADLFTYTSPPTVTSVSPNTGPSGGGTAVTLAGTGLGPVSSVDFGSTPATGLSCSATTCTLTAPAGPTGTTEPVTVVSPAGTSTATPADQYTYGNAPAISGLSPAAGPTAGATIVTITGANLSPSLGVLFGGVAATQVSCSSAMSCVATAPPGTAGAAVAVTDTTGSGVSPTVAAAHYTYLASPAVTGVSPVTGPTTGGTTVAIAGTFGPTPCTVSAVDFGSTAASSYSVNAGCTQVLASSPAGTGTVAVTVTTPGGVSPTASADSFSYVPVAAVTSIAPTSGPTAGGTVVTITGSALMATTAVDFGSTPADSFTCTANTTCTATAPAGSGAVPVTVTAAGVVSSGPAFTYVAPPAPSIPTAPGTPTDVTATGSPGRVDGAGGDPVTVTWTAPANNGGRPITGYVVTGSPGGETCVPSPPTATTCTFTDLPPGTYTFAVMAINAAGRGQPANSSSSFADHSVPTRPRSLHVAAGDRTLTLHFDAPASDGGSGITGYRVSINDGRTSAVVRTRGTKPIVAEVTGVTNGSTYRVTVHAVNHFGTGPASTVVRAKTSNWFHDPVSRSARRAEIEVPADPSSYRGPLRNTTATARSHNGSLAVTTPSLRGRQLQPGEAASLTGTSLFAYDSAKLTAVARTQIEELARSLTDDHVVTCEGYTDYGPGPRYQALLSEQRAKNVCAALKAAGAHVRTITVGYGEARPVVVGGTIADRAANRRVIVVVDH